MWKAYGQHATYDDGLDEMTTLYSVLWVKKKFKFQQNKI